MQKSTFPEELRMLTNKGVVKQGKCKKLRLMLDQKGVIRCESRVQFTLLKAPNNAPILMDADSSFTRSYIQNIHVSNNCAPHRITAVLVPNHAKPYQTTIYHTNCPTVANLLAGHRGEWIMWGEIKP